MQNKTISSSSNVKHVYEHIIRIRQRYLADVTGRLLDHGFGNGVLSQYFIGEGFEVYGVESEDCTFRDCFPVGDMPLANFKFIPADSPTIPFPSSFFDVVVSNQVLNFLSGERQIESVMMEFERVMKPGGKLILTIMAEDNYLFEDYGVPPVANRGLVRVKISGRIERDRIYYRFGSPEEVLSLLEKAGFVLDDLGYFDFKLLDVRCAKHYIILAHKPSGSR